MHLYEFLFRDGEKTEKHGKELYELKMIAFCDISFFSKYIIYFKLKSVITSIKQFLNLLNSRK